jgi:phytoene synthase
MEDLKLYCYRVAGVVGLMSIEIFGYRDSSTRRYAELLGLALQLTNILRDIGKDAIIKRVYLPEELLQRHQLDRHEIISGTYNDNFVNMAEELSEITRSYYQKAHAELSKTDYHPMLPSRIMAKVYFRILTELHRKRFNIFSYPETKVSKRYKYFIAFRLWLSDQLIPKSA